MQPQINRERRNHGIEKGKNRRDKAKFIDNFGFHIVQTKRRYNKI